MSSNYYLDFYGSTNVQTMVSIPTGSSTALNITGIVQTATSSSTPEVWVSDNLPGSVQPLTPVTQTFQIQYQKIINGQPVMVDFDAELVYDGKITITCDEPLTPGLIFSWLNFSVPFER